MDEELKTLRERRSEIKTLIRSYYHEVSKLKEEVKIIGLKIEALEYQGKRRQNVAKKVRAIKHMVR